MITFLAVLVLVFIAVDLFVRFVVDPWLAGSNKKTKVAKSYAPRFDPTVKLATETMYDGGKPHKSDDSSKSSNKENNSNEAEAELLNKK